MAAGSALAGTTAFANMSEVTEAAGFSSPVDFKGAYVGPDSEKAGLGAKGWLYFTDDGTGTIYKHDGSGWIDLGIGGSSVWEDPDGDGVYSLKNGSGIDIERVSDASHNRDQWSTSSVTITVGSDFPTIQEAVMAIPLIPYDDVTIDVPSGFDASTEDVLVPQLHGGYGNNAGGRGFEHKVEIVGDSTTPSNNPLGSIVFSGVQGGFVTLDGFELQRNNPYDDEDTPCAIYHSDAVSLENIEYAGGGVGVYAYGNSHVNVGSIDFGTDILTTGYAVKHNAEIMEQRAGTQSGNVTGYGYVATAGMIRTNRSSSSVTGTQGLVDGQNSRTGFVVTESGNKWMNKFVGEYKVGEEGSVPGEFTNAVAGNGWVVTTPDGTSKYRIRVDNSGNVVTDQI